MQKANPKSTVAPKVHCLNLGWFVIYSGIQQVQVHQVVCGALMHFFWGCWERFPFLFFVRTAPLTHYFDLFLSYRCFPYSFVNLAIFMQRSCLLLIFQSHMRTDIEIAQIYSFLPYIPRAPLIKITISSNSHIILGSAFPWKFSPSVRKEKISRRRCCQKCKRQWWRQENYRGSLRALLYLEHNSRASVYNENLGH